MAGNLVEKQGELGNWTVHSIEGIIEPFKTGMVETSLRSDVNHMFILNVDPRCRVTPEFFFARAATLTTLWILIFGTLGPALELVK